MKSLSVKTILFLISAVGLAIWGAIALYAYPCKEPSYQSNPNKPLPTIVGPYKNPACYDNCVTNEKNQYGETDIGVQTRIADSSDETSCWTWKLGIAAIVISVLAFIFGIIQWVTSDRQARREARAYLHIDTDNTKLGISSVSGLNALLNNQPITKGMDPPIYTICIKNFGQTPAYGVHFINERYRIGKVPPTVGEKRSRPIYDGFPKAIKNKIAPKSTASMGPTQTNYYQTIPTDFSKIEDIGKIRDKDMGLFIEGTVIYRDAFDSPRYSHFRYMHIPEGGQFKGSLTGDLQGNDAT